MNEHFKSHRFLHKLSQGMEKGNALFYLYGKANQDYMFFDFHFGIKEIKDSLFLYFYGVKKMDLFCVIGNSVVTCIDKMGREISVSEAIDTPKTTTGFGANISSQSLGKEKNIDKLAEEKTQSLSGETAFANNLETIEKALNTQKIAIFFDAFEWQSALYRSEKNIELLKRVQSWEKTKQSVIVIHIKEPILLNEFHFNVDEKLSHMIYIGNPTQKEIKNAYRRYITINRSDINMIEEDFDYIATAMQGSQKTLRESMRVLKNVLKNCTDHAILRKELFEGAIHKKIEEKIRLSDVILDVKIKDDIQANVDAFDMEEYSKKGIILYGPPGTGKTYIAKAIAHEYNMNFMTPSLADLKGEYIGQTSVKVKRLFEDARANAPTILFLDEIDTIFPKRSGSDNDSYTTDMVNQFLVEIDGASTGNQKIFIIGATNRLEVIDSAIRSRLSQDFYVPLPGLLNRELIFNTKFKDFKLSKQTWKQTFLLKTEDMSGRDIENFTKSIKQAIREDESKITETLFLKTLQIWEERFVNDFKRDMQGTITIEDKVALRFDDIIGYESIKRILKQELQYILSTKEEKEEMEHFSIIPKRGTLLYGSPGNGKTTFAESLAGEGGFYFIKVLSKDFSGYSSLETLRKIKLILDNTIKLSKITQKKGVVLFFDEIDALIHSNMDSIVRATLLSYLEDKKGMREIHSKVILVAATNHLKALDEASIRDGRFDSKLEVESPNQEEAIKILQRFFEQDETLDISCLNKDFYEKFYKEASQNQQKIPIVQLKNIKEEKKREAYMYKSIKDGKIHIPFN